MRTKEEIIEYLGIMYNCENIKDEFVETALLIEEKYKKQLDDNLYGYGLECDFHGTPFVLEDEDSNELKEVENINGVVVYEIVAKESEEQQL